VEELKAIVKQDPRVSSSTAEIVKTSLQMGPIICEVSSSDDGKQVQQKEILRFPGNNPSEEKSERLHQIRPLHVKARHLENIKLAYVTVYIHILMILINSSFLS
ncbi:hypothetical protein ILYODFUR_038210, partial [Ilyodon furcidens]